MWYEDFRKRQLAQQLVQIFNTQVKRTHQIKNLSKFCGPPYYKVKSPKKALKTRAYVYGEPGFDEWVIETFGRKHLERIKSAHNRTDVRPARN